MSSVRCWLGTEKGLGVGRDRFEERSVVEVEDVRHGEQGRFRTLAARSSQLDIQCKEEKAGMK